MTATPSTIKGREVVDLREKAFFPVEKRSVYVYSNKKYVKLPKHRGIYDTEKNKVLGIVSDSYRLVKNEVAYRFAKRLMGKVFNGIKPDDLGCFNIIQPETRSFCHIDLIHRNRPFGDPFGEGRDRWVAFMRVTNSYNRTQRLRYQIGFCRWICKNGVIFGDKDKRLEFKFDHTRGKLIEVESGLFASSKVADIRALEERFFGDLRALKKCQVRESEMLSFLCRAFDIRADDRTHKLPKRAENLIALRERIRRLTEKYVSEVGENAYAVLNVITEYAGNPVGVVSQASSVHSLQRKAGHWMDDFLSAIKEKEFSNAKYVDGYRRAVSVIEALPGKPKTMVTAQ